jgi:hypothetical protein
MATATRQSNHGIIVLGAEPLSPEVLAAAAACDEVFVVARAIGSGRWIVDEDRARQDAEARLNELRRYLRRRGVRTLGVIVDADAPAAHRDGAALSPGGAFLN